MLRRGVADKFETFRAEDHYIWDFIQLFTCPGSKLSHATGVNVLQISVEAGNPVFFSLFETLIHKRCSKLREIRLLVRCRSRSGNRDPSSTGYTKHSARMIALVQRLLDKKPAIATTSWPDWNVKMDAFWMAEKRCTLISGANVAPREPYYKSQAC